MNPPESFPHTFQGVLDLVNYLRGPDGCPWDQKQNHMSIKEELLEECYELIEAIESNNSESITEELGDTLLNLLMHISIAENKKTFTAKKVYGKLIEKLIRRHPHVFKNQGLKDPEAVKSNWQQIKSLEKPDSSILSGIPKTLPALAFAQQAQYRASVNKFDWDNLEGVLSKIAEESQELKNANTEPEQESEFGDLLFSLVNLARWLNIDAESSLRHANQRFVARFEIMEDLCKTQGFNFFELSLNEKDELWESSKLIESKN